MSDHIFNISEISMQQEIKREVMVQRWNIIRARRTLYNYPYVNKATGFSCCISMDICKWNFSCQMNLGLGPQLRCMNKLFIYIVCMSYISMYIYANIQVKCYTDINVYVNICVRTYEYRCKPENGYRQIWIQIYLHVCV